MGLFSRKSPPAEPRNRARPSVSSEAAARELRVRARRRLVGALALALAVVIVAPMLFDTPADSPPENMIVVPMVVAPAADQPLARTPPVQETPGMAGAQSASGSVILADAAPAQTPAAPVQTTTTTTTTTTPSTPPQTTTPNSAANTAFHIARNNTPATTARATPATPQDRTDDGSVAMALLEGRTPPAAGMPSGGSGGSGNFVLQLAAYNTQQDARTRRERLVQAGITNAYIETTQVEGKTAYRVRVGPFSTREAAQAAQTRVRALGDYKDAFITNLANP